MFNWNAVAPRLATRQKKQDNPSCPVRIVAKVHREGEGSVLYFDVALGVRHLQPMSPQSQAAATVVKRMIDKELKKRGLVRVEKPMVLDDFCYHARAIRLSDWKKWMTWKKRGRHVTGRGRLPSIKQQ